MSNSFPRAVIRFGFFDQPLHLGVGKMYRFSYVFDDRID